MSSNEQTDVARHFHEATTHTPYSIRASTHTLDWDVKPFPFKIYSELPALALPRTIDPLAVDTFAALDPARAASRQSLTIAGLAALLYYSAGVTKKRTYPGGEILFRAAAS